MPAGQGSAGGRGSGGGSKGGQQGGSAGRPSSSTGPSAGGPSTGPTSSGQGAAKSPGIPGPSPTYTERMSGQQSAQSGTPFGADAPDTITGTAGSPTASKKGCGCCGGAVTAAIGAAIVLLICFSLLA